MDIVQYNWPLGCDQLTRPPAIRGTACLPEAKIGAPAGPLSPMEKLVLTALLRQLGKRWVFPGRKRGTRLANLTASWLIDHKAASRGRANS